MLSSPAGGHDRNGAMNREKEPHGVSEQPAERAAGCVDLRLADAVRVEPGALEISAMHTCDHAGGIRYGCDQRRIAQRPAGHEIPVEARGMVAERLVLSCSQDAPLAQIAIGQGTAKRLRHPEQASCAFACRSIDRRIGVGVAPAGRRRTRKA